VQEDSYEKVEKREYATEESLERKEA